MYSVLNNKCIRIDFTDTECTSIEELKRHKWVIPWSGGKDSTATVYLCHQYNIPIEKIVYVRMMWDEEQPATLPIMTEFVDKQAEKFREWGYVVEITESVEKASNLSKHVYKNSKYAERNGKYAGITYFGRGMCKFVEVKEKTVSYVTGKDSYRLIGYTYDEKDRVLRCSKKKSSILKILKLTQKDSMSICETNDALSPLYGLGIPRDGCWFCPNIKKEERKLIAQNYPELKNEVFKMIELCDFDLGFMIGRYNWLDDYVKEKTEIGRMIKIDFSKCRVLEIDLGGIVCMQQ